MLRAVAHRTNQAQAQSAFDDAIGSHYAPFHDKVSRIAEDAGVNRHTAKSYRDGDNLPKVLAFLRLAAVVPPLRAWTLEMMRLESGPTDPAISAELRRLTAMEADFDPDFQRALADFVRMAQRRISAP
jgi:hypothetical protein